MADRIQIRRDTEANWESADPILAQGEIAITLDDLDTEPKFKIGDGVNLWSVLPYFNTAPNHNDLDGLQGIGGDGGYYHLTEDEYNGLGDAITGLPIEIESLSKNIDNEYIFYIKGTTDEIDLSDYSTPAAFKCNLKIIGIKANNDILSYEYNFIAKRVNTNCSIHNIVELDYYKEEGGSNILLNIEIVSTYIMRISIVSAELYKFTGLLSIIERVY